VECSPLRYVQINLWSSSRWCAVPYLCAVYIDDIELIVRKSLVVYTDLLLEVSSSIPTNILLLAPFIDSLQKLVNLCESELSGLDLAINVKKAVCTWIGPRYNVLRSVSMLPQ